MNLHIFNSFSNSQLCCTQDTIRQQALISFHYGVISEIPQTCRWFLFCQKKKKGIYFIVWEETKNKKNNKKRLNIHIENYFKDCRNCQ